MEVWNDRLAAPERLAASPGMDALQGQQKKKKSKRRSSILKMPGQSSMSPFKSPGRKRALSDIGNSPARSKRDKKRSRRSVSFGANVVKEYQKNALEWECEPVRVVERLNSSDSKSPQQPEPAPAPAASAAPSGGASVPSLSLAGALDDDDDTCGSMADYNFSKDSKSTGWGEAPAAPAPQQLATPITLEASPLPPAQLASSSSDLTMEMTAPLGAILAAAKGSARSAAPKRRESTGMEMTQAFGGLLPAEDVEPVEAGVAVPVAAAAPAPRESMGMEMTQALGGLLGETSARAAPASQRRQSTGMEMTRAFGGLLQEEEEQQQQQQASPMPPPRQSMGMEMTQALGGLLAGPGKENEAPPPRQSMGMEMTQPLGGLITQAQQPTPEGRHLAARESTGMDMTQVLGGLVAEDKENEAPRQSMGMEMTQPLGGLIAAGKENAPAPAAPRESMGMEMTQAFGGLLNTPMHAEAPIEAAPQPAEATMEFTRPLQAGIVLDTATPTALAPPHSDAANDSACPSADTSASMEMTETIENSLVQSLSAAGPVAFGSALDSPAGPTSTSSIPTTEMTMEMTTALGGLVAPAASEVTAAHTPAATPSQNSPAPAGAGESAVGVSFIERGSLSVVMEESTLGATPAATPAVTPAPPVAADSARMAAEGPLAAPAADPSHDDTLLADDVEDVTSFPTPPRALDTEAAEEVEEDMTSFPTPPPLPQPSTMPVSAAPLAEAMDQAPEDGIEAGAEAEAVEAASAPSPVAAAAPMPTLGAPSMTVEQLLEKGNVQFLDQATKRRTTQAGRNIPPPSTLQERLEVGVVYMPEKETKEWGCEYLEQLNRELVQKNATMAANLTNPALFRSAEAMSAEELSTRLQRLKSSCRAEAKLTWRNWRVKIETTLRDQLDDEIEGLESDTKTLAASAATLAGVTAWLEAAGSQLQAAHQDAAARLLAPDEAAAVAERLSAADGLAAQLQAARSANAALEAQEQAIEAELGLLAGVEEQLAAETATLSAAVQAANRPVDAQDVEARAEAFQFLAGLPGWAIASLGPDHLHASTCGQLLKLKLAAADGPNRQLQVAGVEISATPASEIHGLLLRAANLDKRLGSDSIGCPVPQTLDAAAIMLGRIQDLERDLRVLGMCHDVECRVSGSVCLVTVQFVSYARMLKFKLQFSVDPAGDACDTIIPCELQNEFGSFEETTVDAVRQKHAHASPGNAIAAIVQEIASAL